MQKVQLCQFKETNTHGDEHAQCLSHVWFFVTLWTVACQPPLLLGFLSQEYWRWDSSPGDFADTGIQPTSCISYTGRWILYCWATWEAPYKWEGGSFKQSIQTGRKIYETFFKASFKFLWLYAECLHLSSWFVLPNGGKVFFTEFLEYRSQKVILCSKGMIQEIISRTDSLTIS